MHREYFQVYELYSFCIYASGVGKFSDLSCLFILQ